MNAKGFFLNAKMGNDLLLAASGEKVNTNSFGVYFESLFS